MYRLFSRERRAVTREPGHQLRIPLGLFRPGLALTIGFTRSAVVLEEECWGQFASLDDLRRAYALAREVDDPSRVAAPCFYYEDDEGHTWYPLQLPEPIVRPVPAA